MARVVSTTAPYVTVLVISDMHPAPSTSIQGAWIFDDAFIALILIADTALRPDHQMVTTFWRVGGAIWTTDMDMELVSRLSNVRAGRATVVRGGLPTKQIESSNSLMNSYVERMIHRVMTGRQTKE